MSYSYQNFCRDTRPGMVVFDFGNVIAGFDNLRFMKKLLEGSSLNPVFLTKLIFSESTLPVEFETGKIGPAEFQKGIQNQVGRTFSPEVFRKAYCDIFEIIPETDALIRHLYGKVRLGLLSNTNILHYEEVIRKIPIFSCFDQVTLSFRVGAMKPDPAIYQDVLQKWNGPAEKVLFLDDVDTYVEGARQAGMKGMTFFNPAEVCGTIRSRYFNDAET
jgi:putative hydrolase of the HAD superfamily